MADGEGAPQGMERRRKTGPPGQVGAAAALLGLAALIDAVWGVVLILAGGQAAARHLGSLGVLALAVAALTVAAALTLRLRPAVGRLLAAAVCAVSFVSGLAALPEGLLPILFSVLVAWLLFGARASRDFFQSGR